MFSTLWNPTSVRHSLGWYDSRREERKEDGGSVYPANGHSADNNPDSSPQVLSGTILADRPASKGDDQLPEVSTPESSVKTPRSHRLQTPRSESAIKDGRRFLSAYRQYKQNETSEDLRSPPDRHRTGRDSNEGNIESLSVPLGLVDAFSDRVERYQSCAPGLARSLEAALTASMERHARGGARVDGLRDELEDTELVFTEDAPAVHPSLAASSPIRQLTPEVLRQVARESEADFLCSVIPELEGESEHIGQPSDYRSIIGPERRSSFLSAVGEVGGEAGRRSLAKSPAENGGSDVSSTADATAVARWESLQRLQQQSLGLGNAAEHQLGRALEVCRNLGLWKDLPRAGGTLGREQAALLDALRSNLHGLEEIVSKKQLVDTTVRQETCALGGPAVISSLLDPASEVERGRPEEAVTISVSPEGSRDLNGTAADEVRHRESVTVSSPSSAGEGIGWVSGPQLKAFEQEIRSRSSLEIASLESERRKLKGKVDMFQRQIQFLQREKEDVSVNETTLATGAKERRDGNGSVSPAARSMTVANLFDSRLGDHRQLQATLEAEVSTLRGSLEEKDGLIDALRQALRTAAATQPTAGRELVATDSRNDADPRAPRTPRDSSAQEVPVIGAVGHVERTRLPQSGRQLPGRARVSRLLDAKSLQLSAGPEAAVVSGAMDLSASPGEDLSREARNGAPNTVRAEVSDTDGLRERLNPELMARNPEPIAQRPAVGSAGTPPPQDSRIASESDLDEEKVSGVANGAVVPAVPAPASATSERERSNSKDDGAGRDGIVSRATTIPGAALRSVWNSARNVGSTVGRRSGSRAGGKGPRHRTESSHAVLIL